MLASSPAVLRVSSLHMSRVVAFAAVKCQRHCVSVSRIGGYLLMARCSFPRTTVTTMHSCVLLAWHRSSCERTCHRHSCSTTTPYYSKARTDDPDAQCYSSQIPSSNYPRCPVRTVKAERPVEFIPGVVCAAASGLGPRGARPFVGAKSRPADVGSHAPSHSAPIVFLLRVGGRARPMRETIAPPPPPRQSGGRGAGGEEDDLVESNLRGATNLIAALPIAPLVNPGA